MNRATKALPLLCTAVACVGLLIVAALAREWVHPDCAMYYIGYPKGPNHTTTG